MKAQDKKFALYAKIFLIIALTAFIIGNALAIACFDSARSSVSGYNAGMIQDPIGALAYLGMMLTTFISCIVTAGIGNLLSILFTSFSLSFTSKAIHTCSHTPRYIKPLSITLLIISIVALIFTIPTAVFLAFLIGV